MSSIQNLNTLVDNVSTLLGQLDVTLSSIPSPTVPSSPPSPSAPRLEHPLEVLATATELIKAHATKVSLLSTTAPFTPSAMATVLRELFDGPVPALVASVQAACGAGAAEGFSEKFREHLVEQGRRVLREMQALLQSIPRDGKSLQNGRETSGARTTARRQTQKTKEANMAATGVAWHACDDMIRFAQQGLGGFFASQLQVNRDMILDTLEELKEWKEELNDEGDDDDEDDAAQEEEEDDDFDDVQDLMDATMNPKASVPKADRAATLQRLDLYLRHFRLVSHLFDAITKRRLKTLPAAAPPPAPASVPVADTPSSPPSVPTPQTIGSALDDLLRDCSRLAALSEDVAAGFYYHDVDEVQARHADFVRLAVDVTRPLDHAWTGAADEFTTWAGKFREQISLVGPDLT